MNCRWELLVINDSKTLGVHEHLTLLGACITRQVDLASFGASSIQDQSIGEAVVDTKYLPVMMKALLLGLG